MRNNFTMRRFVIAGILLLFLLPGITATARLAIQMEQKVVSVIRVGLEDNLVTGDGEMFKLKDEKVVRKASSYVGKQARVLYFQIAEKLICVDIAPITAQPFQIDSRPTPSLNTKPL